MLVKEIEQVNWDVHNALEERVGLCGGAWKQTEKMAAEILKGEKTASEMNYETISNLDFISIQRQQKNWELR